MEQVISREQNKNVCNRHVDYESFCISKKMSGFFSLLRQYQNPVFKMI
jgi:hypothetical protein